MPVREAFAESAHSSPQGADEARNRKSRIVCTNFGRSGFALPAYSQRGRTGLLPQILTGGEVLDAIAKVDPSLTEAPY